MDTNADSSRILRQKRDELYKAARDHPGSDEDQIVEILLLSAMSKMEPVPYDAMPGIALGDERRRFQAVRERRVRERRVQQGTPAADVTQTTAGPGNESVAELQLELERRQRRLEKIEEALESAQAAMAAGEPMTDAEIYKRIAAVVGLNAPLIPTGPAHHRPLPEGQHTE